MFQSLKTFARPLAGIVLTAGMVMPAHAQSLKTDLEKCAFQASCVKKVHQQSKVGTNALYKTVLSNQSGAQRQRLMNGHKQFLNYRKTFCQFSARQSGKLNPTALQVCEAQLNIQYSTMLEGFLISP